MQKNIRAFPALKEQDVFFKFQFRSICKTNWKYFIIFEYSINFTFWKLENIDSVEETRKGTEKHPTGYWGCESWVKDNEF